MASSSAKIPLWLFVPNFVLLLLSVLPLCAIASTVSSNYTDHLALLSFKAELSSDPLGVMSSWNDSNHFCFWEGVTCGRRHQRVTSINLRSRSLAGQISSAIGNLSFLQELVLHGNTFTGFIPPQIGRLARLRRLGLGNSSFSGKIPTNVSQCLQLVELHLAGNRLVGTIPFQFQSLLKLQRFFLYSNNLTGTIPSYLGNLSALQRISGLGNNFEGSIPSTLGQLTNLSFLGFATNLLSGTIPPSIFNISTLTNIDFPQNQIGGSLPPDIGRNLGKLEQLNIAENQFTGDLPATISNASRIMMVAVHANRFSGRFPDLNGLQFLQVVTINRNQFGSRKADDLSFLSFLVNCTKLRILHLSFNNFGGVLPKLIGNFTGLQWFSVGGNPISGNIPAEIGGLVNIETLTLGPNQFTGSIPGSIGKLQNLKLLSLNGNKISGEIPFSLGNLTMLTELYLGSNNLEGTIPSSIGNCQKLLLIDMHTNNLSGRIPKELLSLSSLSILLDLSDNRLNDSLFLNEGDLENLVSLDVSDNMLAGEIPSSLGRCITLTDMLMGGNFFKGTIPQSLRSLRGLEVLDFSRNNLSGKIPEYLGNFSLLRNLNLSFNDLEGNVPVEGAFLNASAISIIGNRKLCGGNPELKLPKCATKKSRTSHVLKFIIPLSVGAVVISLVLSLYFYISRCEKVSPRLNHSMQGIPRVSYGSLYKATNGFSVENLVGSGRFGSVYKGILNQKHTETVVAVKVLNLHVEGANKSFEAEREALRNIRHRNVVKILTSCAGIDYQRNDFKALVYEFMSNGSLDSWLHQGDGSVAAEDEDDIRSLTLLERVDIAIDVAHALVYLHCHCQTTLVHCDLKPSNVLLDEDLVAHLGDFGLAEFRKPEGSLDSDQSKAVGVKGTIGYAAPEYGMGMEVSTHGDVYSYGILLLEMFTGKRPTNDMFKDGLSLHSYVETALPERAKEISDPTLFSDREKKATSERAEEECLVSVYWVAVACSAESPNTRMDINDVIGKLEAVRHTLQK